MAFVSAMIPDNEVERLAALERYGILDTLPESEFDRVVQLVAAICDVPIALVSLVAQGRQWFKAEIGLGCSETSRQVSICSHAILEHELFEVPDTTKDERFSENPLVVGDPHLRFYAGAQLRTADGYVLGMLCVLDKRPRALDEEQRTALSTLADHVMTILELRRSNERQRQLNAQVSAAVEAQQRVLAAVSHDIRSPLNTISLAAELMMGSSTSRADVGVLAGRVHRAAQQLQRLAEDLVDEQNLARGAFTVNLKPAPLSPLIEELMERFADQAARDGVQLRVAHGARAVALSCDQDRLMQALSNLVSNALAHTPAGGVVRIEVQELPGEVEIAVHDSGPGVPESDLPQVFEPYFRGDRPVGRGMGLGLSIVRSLTEAHGGRVAASNHPEGGARFSVVLPLRQGGFSPSP